MNIFRKKISEIDYRDIKTLVDGKMEEGTYLDYKRAISSAEEAKAELGRDVSAFANTEGGTLILGVEERKVERRGKQVVEPVSICGVPQVYKGQETRLWLEQVIKSTTRRMVNTSVHPVKIADNQDDSVFIIYVPKSNHAPHMLWSEGSKHHGRYFKRRNFQNEIAEEYEVRELFERSARLEHKFRDYLARTGYGLRGKPPSHEWYDLSLVCCPLILEDRLIDITQKEKLFVKEPTFSWPTPLQGQHLVHNGQVQPSEFGLSITETPCSLVLQQVALGIHRNGYMDFVARVGKHKDGRRYVDKWVIEFLLAFMDYCTKALVNFHYYGNVALFLTINTRHVLFYGERQSRPVVPFHSEEAHVQITDEVYIGDLEANLSRALRPLADRLYQCFGFWKAACFDENNRYIG